jgi:hypothetical protein
MITECPIDVVEASERRQPSIGRRRGRAIQRWTIRDARVVHERPASPGKHRSQLQTWAAGEP